MSDEDAIPEFPQYAPPTGIPLADRNQSKPLLKMIKTLLKPKMRPIKPVRKVHRAIKRKKHRWY